ncbi:hypothetical protein K1719_016145 [Acacia pycnantha]|nr:hypothetical protein K1719_016145 [Acacia pycnantha]
MQRVLFLKRCGCGLHGDQERGDLSEPSSSDGFARGRAQMVLGQSPKSVSFFAWTADGQTTFHSHSDISEQSLICFHVFIALWFF